MQTFLIASQNKSFIEEKLKTISKKLNVSPVNLVEIKPQNSVSIADVRKLAQTIMLKPYGGGDRLIIIYDIDKATLEAENALLKILEEPPQGNFIVLICNNINKLLPTVISRSQIIEDNEKSSHKEIDFAETKKLLGQIIKSTPGERILISQKLSNSREETAEVLTNLIFALEKLLHNPDNEISLTAKEIAILLTKITAAKNYVERYINFKATLDILLLGFPKKI